MKFVGRKQELNALNKEYEKEGSSFVVIYGRRRIGKTRLIEEFIRDKKAIYYLASDEHEHLQIKEYKDILADSFNDTFLKQIEITDWKSLFQYLGEKIDPKEKLILVIDEITFLIKQNKSFTSYLQKIWDLSLSKKNVMIILSGSIIGLMINEILSYKSPLYGRRTLDLKLDELNFSDSTEFVKNYPLEDKFETYFVLGGVPKYLEIINSLNIMNFSSLLKYLFSKYSFFYREGYYLLSEEFSDINTYLSILKAISFGKNKMNELATYLSLDSKKISSYLDILINLNFVNKELPVVDKKSRNSLYFLNDNFLLFWNRFILSNRSYIEIDKTANLISDNRDILNSYFGLMFEKFIRDNVVFSGYSIVGKQWGKFKSSSSKSGKNTYEIDICAINEQKKEILFGECKWKNKVNAKSIAKQLDEKIEYVNWYKDERKETLVIFAKSFSKRITQFNNKPVKCYDLKDLEKMLKKK